MMTTEIKLSSTPPFRWEGYVCLSPLEIAMVVTYLPRNLAIRRLLQVNAGRAAAKAQKINELPGAL
jgi:hypothetical protein